MVGIKKFRDSIIPVIDTVKRLRIPAADSIDAPNRYTVVFEINTANGTKRFGALVDKVLVVKEITSSEIKSIEEIEKSASGAAYISGVLTDDSGSFTYVLLPEKFFSSHDFESIASAMRM